jgi:hypothetical protein
VKIEIGESLFYSWLRHAKECTLVQCNWKASPSWELRNMDAIEQMIINSDIFFKNRYDFEIFKSNNLSQLLQQAEIDVLGVSTSDSGSILYAIDVAYHGSGLNYGDKKETTTRVVKKILRTAMCIHGYFDTTKAEIVFASPKINPANLIEIEPTISDINNILNSGGWNYTARIITNDDFSELVMKPIMIASDNVSDTSELFLRAYQLVKMFDAEPRTRRLSTSKQIVSSSSNGALGELKIGKIAQTLLRDILESGNLSDVEVEQMQTSEYSKRVFGIDFPLLVSADVERNKVRYYTNPLRINGNRYYMCSQWFEVPANNDRPFLMNWLNEKEIYRRNDT